MKTIIITVAVTLLVTLCGVGVYAASENQQEYGVFTPFPKTEVKKETKQEPIAFTVEKTEDATMSSGQEVTKQNGENGTQTYTYRVTYKGKKQVKTELINSEVTTAPKNAIVAVGTYTAPVAAPVKSSSSGASKRSALVDSWLTPKQPTYCISYDVVGITHTTCN